MGTEGKNIACQLKICINMPPKEGPKSPPTATIHPLSPSAFPLSFPLKSEAITDDAFEITIEAPNASTHLKTISMGKFCAKQFKKEPHAKRAKPVAYSLFFGTMSPILPQNGKNTVKTSV